MTLLIFMTVKIQVAKSQQTQATYNLSLALESMNSTTLLSQVTNLVSVISLTPLTATSVQADACQAGSYSLDDAQTCTLCPTGKYSGVITAVSIDTCVSCGAGKFQNITGASSETQCINCPANTYFTGTSGGSLSVCVECPSFSASFPGSQLLQSCVCNPGYSGPNGKNYFPEILWDSAGMTVCPPQEAPVRPATHPYGA